MEWGEQQGTSKREHEGETSRGEQQESISESIKKNNRTLLKDLLS